MPSLHHRAVATSGPPLHTGIHIGAVGCSGPTVTFAAALRCALPRSDEPAEFWQPTNCPTPPPTTRSAGRATKTPTHTEPPRGWVATAEAKGTTAWRCRSPGPRRPGTRTEEAQTRRSNRCAMAPPKVVPSERETSTMKVAWALVAIIFLGECRRWDAPYSSQDRPC